MRPIEKKQDVGKYLLANIANCDQTPLQFEFLSGTTYENKGNKTVWVQSQQSGLDKRQATVHLCIFADGIPRIKPAIIFPGKGQLRDRNKRSKYNKGVTVYFQKKA